MTVICGHMARKENNVMEVVCKMMTKEKAGDVDENTVVCVRSHPIYQGLVILESGGFKLVLSAKELITAIENATRTARY